LLAFFIYARILKEDTGNKLLREIKKVWKLKENQRKGYYDNKYKIIIPFFVFYNRRIAVNM